ncbi:oligosaccharide flippase family protein [Actinoplanes sp. NPDC049316]|uniref:oligosaccharide flippase family protein n=1 Tax=Actinoplanes sp. NPDC049316 TaxID=3154727 RepID=UPI0034254BF6
MPATLPPGDTSLSEKVARTRGLRNNLAWSLTGNATYAAMQWITVVGIAWFGNAEMVGQFSLALAVTAPLTLLAAMSLRTVFVTDVSLRFTFADYFLVRLVAMLLAFIAIAVISMRFQGQTRAVIAIVGIAKVVDGIGDILVAIFHKANDMRRMAISSILNGILTATFVTTILLISSNMVLACWGSVLASVASSILYCTAALRRTANPPPSASLLGRPAQASVLRRLTHSRALVLTALPLGFAAFLSSVTWNIPRYVLSERASIATLGIFSAISYIPTTINVGAAALAQNLLPKFTAMRHNAENARVRQLVYRFLLLSAACAMALSAACYFGGETLLALAYGPEYGEQTGLLTLLTATTALGVGGFILDAALSSHRQFAGQLAANTMALVACVVLSLLLIPQLGIVGAGMASAGVTLVLLAAKTVLFVLSMRTPVES